jgi:acetyl-CoA carboxylase biotin carboxyl carrier protein
MDLKLIQRLIAMMERGGVGELEIDDHKDGLKVRLKRQSEAQVAAPMVQLVHGGGAAPLGAANQGGLGGGGGAPAALEAPKPQGTPVASPMIGTFYRSPSPESPAFVEVGSRVAVDQTLCIIEAMKVMNEIKSEIAGEVLEILVENGEPVEFGQPLFLVKTS